MPPWTKNHNKKLKPSLLKIEKLQKVNSLNHVERKTREEIWDTGTVVAVINLDLHKSLPLTHAFTEEGFIHEAENLQRKKNNIFIS